MSAGRTTVFKARESCLDGKADARRTREGAREMCRTRYIVFSASTLRIVKSFGVETIPGVKALKLERATIGCAWKHTLEHRDDPPPIHARLRVALAFAEAMAYLHQEG
jgi:hypothetical protein